MFIDRDREERRVVFATPGRGRECLEAFCEHIKAHGGHPDKISEVVCDMSPAFLSAVEKNFTSADVTVDWFHVVQLFTNAVDAVRKLETKQRAMPKNTRWTVLMAQERNRTAGQADALRELVEGGFATAKAYRVKELLRWIRKAETKRAARWRVTNFLRHASQYAGESPLLEPVRKALASFQRHLPRIIHRWHSLHTNARLEGLNGLFQAARARARGYRNVDNFIAMAYLIAAPIQELIAIK